MPGPPPKLPSNRRRRNPPAGGEWTMLGDPPSKRPALPRPYPKGGWSPAAKTAWKSWWSSPVASMWDPSDHDTVEMLLRLIHNWDPPTASQATAIQRFKNGLGLTPAGRRQLRWMFPREEPDPADAVIDAPGSNVRRIRAVESGEAQ